MFYARKRAKGRAAHKPKNTIYVPPKYKEVEKECVSLLRALARCAEDNPDLKEREKYHGSGITVCDRWSNPFGGLAAFIEDIGLCPSDDHFLMRLDWRKGYDKENCVWATQAERKQRNRDLKAILPREKPTIERLAAFAKEYESIEAFKAACRSVVKTLEAQNT